MKITPDELIHRYWRYPWVFKLNGDLIIHVPNRPPIRFKEADYVPKAHRTNGLPQMWTPDNRD